MLRAACLSLLLVSGCVSSHGKVNVPATTGAWGAMLVIGGAASAVGTCEPSDEQCDRVEKGDPAVSAGFIIGGAALLALAWVLYATENPD